MSDIETILEGRPRDLGGFTVGRVLPAVTRRSVGPFVFLDHMGPADVVELVVRPHPHLHLATVTYLFDGEIVHRDSLGSKQTITPGAINWMSAGRGIVHSERMAPEMERGGLAPTLGEDAPKKHVHGLQLWVGLPTAAEDTDPFFMHHPASTLPIVDERGVHIRVLGGTAFGVTSPIKLASPLFDADIRLAAGARVELPTNYAERAAYVIEGSVTAGTELVEPRRMAVFTPRTNITLEADGPTRLVVLGGEPLDGPRFMWWNFVSSSKERIIDAAQRWRDHQFPLVPDDADYTPAPDQGPKFSAS